MRWERFLWFGVAGLILVSATMVHAGERGLIFRSEYEKLFARGIESADPRLDGYQLLKTVRRAIISDKVNKFRVETGNKALWVVGYRPGYEYGPIEIWMNKTAESWGIGSLVQIQNRNRGEELVFFIPDNFRYIALLSRKFSSSVSVPSSIPASREITQPSPVPSKPVQSSVQISPQKYVFSDEVIEVPPMNQQP